MYHSGKSDEEKLVERPIQKEETPKVIETIREKIGGFFKKDTAHRDYPSSEPYDGPTTTTLRAAEVEGEPIHGLVSVYSSGRSDELPAVTIPVEEVAVKEAKPKVTKQVVAVLKKPVPSRDYPVSEAYVGELEDTIRSPEVFGT